MPTFIKTGFWDKLINNNPQQAKAPKGWLNLDNFVQTIAPPSTNIYNSDGTLTGNRQLNGGNNDLTFSDLNVFKTSLNNSNKGLWLDFTNENYEFGNKEFGLKIENLYDEIIFGDYGRDKNQTSLTLDDNNQIIKTQNQGNDIGLKLDFANSLYQLGQLTGGNATTLKIDDAAAFPVQVSGTNVTQNTSGAASGKFLKIKVDGVDYVIELKNPS